MVTFFPEWSPIPAQLTVRRMVCCDDIRSTGILYSKLAATSWLHHCNSCKQLMQLTLGFEFDRMSPLRRW